MEADRYQYGHFLFIAGLFSLFFGLFCLAFSIYLMPNVVFGYIYNIPEFIFTWHHNLQSQSGYTRIDSGLIIFFSVFALGAFCVFIAYLSSNYIDNKIYYSFSSVENLDLNLVKKKVTQDGVNGAFMSLKVAFIILLVFGLAFLFERLLVILL